MHLSHRGCQLLFLLLTATDIGLGSPPTPAWYGSPPGPPFCSGQRPDGWPPGPRTAGRPGNSTEPHLHFQLLDGPDPDTARGLPVRRRGIGVPANGEVFDAGPRP